MVEAPPYRFPGMDPWLEHPAIWPSVHGGLIQHMAEDLNSRIIPRSVASCGFRVIVENAEEYEQGFVEVRMAGEGGRVVSIVEVLSPANKHPGTDAHQKYRKKQAEVLASDVHLVEIDLLRGGDRMVAVPRDKLTPCGPYEYLVTICRANRRTTAEVYPIRLRDRLPRIPIPLARPDPDAVLDLQALLEGVYRAGAHGLRVGYDRPPVPPLSPEDATWANEKLGSAGV